ncbi:hypothetical protein llap_5429 [Limosa lapponica baueri]|uniref:Uncharacterized protein n=1 Tax=Limosa lapponica baueri TaxID=1758121 RepID=A0A2I0UE17_LIMLA|nr:hypothetical protein llap_5429 [Limosa lapponica baueri]
MKSVAKPPPDSHVGISSFRSTSSNKPRRNLYPPQHSSLPDPQTLAKVQLIMWGFEAGIIELVDANTWNNFIYLVTREIASCEDILPTAERKGVVAASRKEESLKTVWSGSRALHDPFPA